MASGLSQLLGVGQIPLSFSLACERAGEIHVAGAMVGENPPLELLGTRGLRAHLALEALGDPRHPREREVVLRHPRAEFLARCFHERFRVRFFDAADEQPEKAAEQPSDAPKHASTPPDERWDILTGEPAGR